MAPAPRAYVLIKPEPAYRRDAFIAGLKAAGYDARPGVPQSWNGGDVLVTWNRYGEYHEHANRMEAAGGTVLVAENGYVTRGGGSPHGQALRDTYALAIGGHNGSGTWPAGGPERWDALGIDLNPWRTDGGHILVCPNRSFGRPDLIMPPSWGAHVCKRLAALTQREIRLRPHPGNKRPTLELARDLENCWAVVIWSSSAGVHALIAGVPVICEAPAWICKDASLELADLHVGSVMQRMCLREYQLQRLAWAQWHVDELAAGEPFRRLLARESADERAVA